MSHSRNNLGLLGLFVHLFLSSAAVMVMTYLVPGVTVDGWTTALIVAIVLGIVNVTIRPILLILTLPVNILTLGFFTLLINALMLLLVDSLVTTFTISSFGSAILATIVLSIITWFFDLLSGRE
ncbi:hypothetical protein COW46_03485 [Candidatus Gracilibacteria bacterium CG17_big_fil_post_rev_8_21_14_2_50_48_13]|nr:MAG: hypothetical protein COW46_03485 [Candidatus Gracilibacteria bacterium CG17_big_fil_post_rev_8_21_14_2_50_48_13]